MKVTRRLEALRIRLEGAQLEAAVITDPVNVAYLTGFENVFDTQDAHAAVVTAGSAWVLTDSRYFEAASAAAADGPWEVRLLKEHLYVTVCAQLTEAEITSIAVESSVPYGRYRFISRQFEGTVEGVDNWIEEIRQVKEAEEIGRIEAAQQLSDRAFEYILDHLRPGATERDIAIELECFMRREGSEGVAFDAIIASGPNSALPHAKVTTRELRTGDFVKLDFGARVGGYCSDMTRTVVIGRASDRQREIYSAVLAANAAGIEAVRPGLPGSVIDAAARDVLTERGFGDNFGHGLGHGVGLQVHELPGLGPRSDKSVLEGSVVTIEPGVYVPGFGGVRIEDLVVVEGDGARVLTRSGKDLIEV